MSPEDNVARARAYLSAIERFAPAEELETFLAPGVVQEEFPNRLLANGATRDLAALREAGVRGKALLSAQRFDVQSAVAAGDTVALEIVWTGTLAIPFQHVPAGGTLRARFAFFMEFSDGRVTRMRNYDCFDPW